MADVHREEGALGANKRTLLELWRLRWGALPAETEQTIQMTQDADQLAEWLRRFTLSVQSSVFPTTRRIPMRVCLRKPSAFTLIELLVVLAIIAVLLGILIPAVQKVREAAARTQTLSNLRQVTLGTVNYNDQMGRLPKGYGPIAQPTAFNYVVNVQILPFVEQDNLFQAIVAWNEIQIPMIDDWRFAVTPVYLSPQDYSSPSNTGPGGYPAGNYAANLNVFSNPSLTGVDALINSTARIPRSFPDGVSNTVLFSTRLAICGSGGSEWCNGLVYPYTSTSPPGTMGAYFGAQLPDAQGVGLTFQDRPSAATCDPEYAHAMGLGGLPVSMADGSARLVSPSISGMTWRSALLPADGVPLSSDWYE